VTANIVCARCGAPITLRRISKNSDTFRWFSSDKGDSWHCGNDPDFPVRSHRPNLEKVQLSDPLATSEGQQGEEQP